MYLFIIWHLLVVNVWFQYLQTNLYPCYEQQLFYLDRVEFGGKGSKYCWFPTTNIRQLMQLNKRINTKRSSLGSMERARQLTKWTIGPSFVHLKLTYKMNWQAWDEKTMGASSLLHQLMSFHQPFNHHGQNIEVRQNLQLAGSNDWICFLFFNYIFSF